MADTKKRPILRTPKGVARFPYLNKADTKFDAEGVYKADLVFSSEDAEGLTEIVEAAQKEALAEANKKAAEQKKKGKKVTPKAADLPTFEVLDDDGNETGEVGFRFKSKASGTSQKTGKQWSRTMPLFDAKGKPTKSFIYGGSVLKLAYTAQPWVNPKLEYGVKLQLEGVQVIELVSGGGTKSASQLGFGEEEGFEGSDETETEESETDFDGEQSNTDTTDGDDDEF